MSDMLRIYLSVPLLPVSTSINITEMFMVYFICFYSYYVVVLVRRLFIFIFSSTWLGPASSI